MQGFVWAKMSEVMVYFWGHNTCNFHCYAWLVAVKNMHSGSKTTKNSMEFPTLPVVNEGRAGQ